MWIGWIEFDLLLGDVHSLKEKRAVLRPILAELRREGALVPPTYLPPWATDIPFLAAYMSYSAFLNETDLAATRAGVEELIARAEASLTPVV